MNPRLSPTLAQGSPPRLGQAALAALPADVVRPAYARGATRIGIVHLGAGAFHRAHQAAYIDELLRHDPAWAICAVSLHSRGPRDALAPQDGLYTLVTLAEPRQLRVIGSIREVLCAQDQREAVLARLGDAGVRLVTLTVTEKGYCLAGDGLDVAHPGIVQDLAAPQAPRSAIGYLVEGLRRRRERGLPPYTVLSCDNLPDNGGRLRRAVLQYAERIDPALAQWIGSKCAFPRSMVDSITPASDDTLRRRVTASLGFRDAWPVQREPFAQWVVEDRFCNGRPPLERVGVQFSDDIGGYDRAKLRLLNAAHSSLAYLGLLLGIERVSDAMRDPALAGFVVQLMRDDIRPTLPAIAGFDADGYIDAILQRFRNPAIQHRLEQIAWDGSQKLPVRLLGTLADALAAGRPIARLCLPVAAWMQFVRRRSRAGVSLVDPMAPVLAAAGLECNGEASHDVALFLALQPVFGALRSDPRVIRGLREAWTALGDGSPGAVRQSLQGGAG